VTEMCCIICIGISFKASTYRKLLIGQFPKIDPNWSINFRSKKKPAKTAEFNCWLLSLAN